MGNRHPKMSKEERAKQFMPFDALKGFREVLKAKEEEHQDNVENGLKKKSNGRSR